MPTYKEVLDALTSTTKELNDMRRQIVAMRNEVEQMKKMKAIQVIDEFSLGTGETCIKMNSEGLWIGARSFREASGTPPAGTAIAINGDFYPKNGVSGSFVADGGAPTITVVRGVVTSIA